MTTLSAGNYTFNYNGGEGSQVDLTNGFPDGTNDYPLNFEAEGESYTKITIGRNGNRHWVTVGPYAQEYDLDDAIVYDDTLDGKTITVTEEQSVDSALKSFFDNYTDYSALPVPKSVSDSNLARFKDNCDETYAPMSRALPVPKSVSDSNLARFKDNCDETYAPMSRALPAPAGTTDAGKVPTVNSAGNGYTLQTPSGGSGAGNGYTLQTPSGGGNNKLYLHRYSYSENSSDTYDWNAVIMFISSKSSALTIEELKTLFGTGVANLLPTFSYGVAGLKGDSSANGFQRTYINSSDNIVFEWVVANADYDGYVVSQSYAYTINQGTKNIVEI